MGRYVSDLCKLCLQAGAELQGRRQETANHILNGCNGCREKSVCKLLYNIVFIEYIFFSFLLTLFFKLADNAGLPYFLEKLFPPLLKISFFPDAARKLNTFLFLGKNYQNDKNMVLMSNFFPINKCFEGYVTLVFLIKIGGFHHLNWQICWDER